jgi:hypothetical protein
MLEGFYGRKKQHEGIIAEPNASIKYFQQTEWGKLFLTTQILQNFFGCTLLFSIKVYAPKKVKD